MWLLLTFESTQRNRGNWRRSTQEIVSGAFDPPHRDSVAYGGGRVQDRDEDLDVRRQRRGWFDLDSTMPSSLVLRTLSQRDAQQAGNQAYKQGDHFGSMELWSSCKHRPSMCEDVV